MADGGVDGIDGQSVYIDNDTRGFAGGQRRHGKTLGMKGGLMRARSGEGSVKIED